MYGVNLNVLAERRAALHFKATRLQARAVCRVKNWRLERNEEVKIASNVMKR